MWDMEKDVPTSFPPSISSCGDSKSDEGKVSVRWLVSGGIWLVEKENTVGSSMGVTVMQNCLRPSGFIPGGTSR